MRRPGPALLTIPIVLGAASAFAAEKTRSEVRADVVDPNEDFSAHRLDSEVFGWSKDFKEVAVLGSNITRGRASEQRGERMLLVFDVGVLTPKQNLQVDFHTQAALPHDPIPIPDVREWMWNIGYEYPKMWPKKPQKKQPKGAIKIEPVWEFNGLGDNLCQPIVGFVLEWKGEKRYQPHQQLELRGDCDRLRYTDHRTYWGKKDLGAVMIRFDHGPPKNEASVRFVLSASWELAQPVHLLIRTATEVTPAELERVKSLLATYGNPRVESGSSGTTWAIAYQPSFIYLAHRLAAQLNGEVAAEPAPAAADLLVYRRAASSAGSQSKGLPTRPRDTELDTSDCGGLLRDCDR
jgi:hypothetical protein